MKNTNKDIIKRFQKFDFDPKEKNQKRILNKINSKSSKKKVQYFKFTFVAAFSVLIAVIAINKYSGKDQILTVTKGNNNIIENNKDENVKIQYSKLDEKENTAKSKSIANNEERRQELYAKDKQAENLNMLKYEISENVNYNLAYDMAYEYEEEKVAYPRSIVNYHKVEPDYNNMQSESYKNYGESGFLSVASNPLSTFSADVDMASYNIIKRMIMSGEKPNSDAVRIEEFLNYFDYSYQQPKGADPVSVNFEYTDSPWNKGLKLIKIGIKAKKIEKSELPPSNLVFLIDVSGSMSSTNRLPLVKKSLKLLVDELRPQDRVSIVTYANGTNKALSAAKGSEKKKIMDIIESLEASGGTYGAGGLKVAYEVAKENFIKNGNNRVILATDGDFNIGASSESELEKQITQAKDSGVFLSVLGYGMGNYKDSKVQVLANKGNGNYAYINDLSEARKTLVKEFGATLFTVAKDVKLQVEFNPEFVAAYRIIGYEKRALDTQDFNDDTKDAGEIGAGHTVTVLYEIIPTGVKTDLMPSIDDLKYIKQVKSAKSDEILTLKIRYKEPNSDVSKLMEKELNEENHVSFDKTSDDMRFAVSVAQFGQILKDSQYKGIMTIDEIIKVAKKAKGSDDEGYRSEFIKMVEMYKMIK